MGGRPKLLILDLNGLLVHRVFVGEGPRAGVWTTASAINATPLLKGLLPEEDVARLAFIWDGKRCTYNGETDPAKPGKPIAFKELRRLWESKDVAGLFGPSNTLMIDDSRYKASLNPPHTAIHPPAWDDPDAHASDDALGSS
ncbi:hypothetical protein NGA_0707200 [Nannochloropsis gaditana CCMP526]|uniref:uncharacterized protein n=1 Tax=Nannochloropsis gaditana (strain CCMP526) TaxID=1093141 RepID=UPI00029F5CB2|nr:hypothetical protein NGA_0707200 [Nannochloropsis gaditana CCMP526]EKU23302.1 hypothetical protein NGA_0707200 [Nannochloropsis gaditana CCMP526]|eukprot:XP_005852529.1 hypothetical protein NGA_0707200 [Nannochloropsis gaditana CCMP526]